MEPDYIILARAVLMFFDANYWTPEKHRKWVELTSNQNVTTKALGDLARKVLDNATRENT